MGEYEGRTAIPERKMERFSSGAVLRARVLLPAGFYSPAIFIGSTETPASSVLHNDRSKAMAEL
jgi:hypothetical protein